jgi:hypothetical protein
VDPAAFHLAEVRQKLGEELVRTPDEPACASEHFRVRELRKGDSGR